jgi:hypothetical protein
MRKIRKLSEEPPHSINEHNYYIRYAAEKVCPKCKKGSKVVHETELEEKK